MVCYFGRGFSANALFLWEKINIVRLVLWWSGLLSNRNWRDIILIDNRKGQSHRFSFASLRKRQRADAVLDEFVIMRSVVKFGSHSKLLSGARAKKIRKNQENEAVVVLLGRGSVIPAQVPEGWDKLVGLPIFNREGLSRISLDVIFFHYKL